MGIGGLPESAATPDPVNAAALPNDSLNPVFGGHGAGTEEAIINATFGAETMTGAHGSRVTTLTRSTEGCAQKVQPLAATAVR